MSDLVNTISLLDGSVVILLQPTVSQQGPLIGSLSGDMLTDSHKLQDPKAKLSPLCF